MNAHSLTIDCRSVGSNSSDALNLWKEMKTFVIYIDNSAC